MYKKLSNYGNSKALIIDKPILELLNIEDSTILEITTDGKTLFITPRHKETKKKTINNSKNKDLEEIIKKNSVKYAEVLKKLAK